jgi:hypothetical protein
MNSSFLPKLPAQAIRFLIHLIRRADHTRIRFIRPLADDHVDELVEIGLVCFMDLLF